MGKLKWNQTKRSGHEFIFSSFLVAQIEFIHLQWQIIWIKNSAVTELSLVVTPKQIVFRTQTKDSWKYNYGTRVDPFYTKAAPTSGCGFERNVAVLEAGNGYNTSCQSFERGWKFQGF